MTEKKGINRKQESWHAVSVQTWTKYKGPEPSILHSQKMILQRRERVLSQVR